MDQAFFYNPGVGRPHTGPVLEEIISESEKSTTGIRLWIQKRETNSRDNAELLQVRLSA